MLTILEVHGVAADISLARRWYEKARASGSAEAQRRLDILAAGVQTPPATIDHSAQPVPLPRARPPLSAQDTRGGRQSRAALAGQNR
jgi:TPR repeat protein